MTNTAEIETTQVEPLEAGAVHEAALALIDQGLGDMMHRELVSTDEVSDLLLDLRLLLATEAATASVN
jgi:hypothetical protein